MRWAVLLALSAATAMIYIVSMRANYLYGYSLGQTPERRELFAWANVAADIWKGFGLVAVILLWREHKRMALLAMLAWLVCLTTGVNSAIGVYVHDRAAFIGVREAQHSSYADAQKLLGDTQARIKTLGTPRSEAQVEAAIAAALTTPVMVSERVRGTVGSISSNCTKHDTRTASACADIARLREELAAAQEDAVLRAQLEQLQQRVEALRERGGSLAPDPVGEFWTWATRGLLSVRDVGFGFPLAFALLIEIVSAFGPAVIVSVAIATRHGASLPQPAAAGTSVQQPAVLRHEEERVAQWLADRTEPTSSAAGMSTDVLHADYADWCSSRKFHPAVVHEFADALDHMRGMSELTDKIRKFGDRYYGLRLVSVTAERPVARVK